ncbi:DUF4860 domain-containing protein [Clostridia bacterium OttesenSCG-928-F22]|nr:DUF4860 domain-containing protein [Clostridia bacterium OttesenSCG-928-F22]
MQPLTRMKKRSLSGFIPTIILVCLFSVSVLLVASFGLKVYIGIQNDSDRAFEQRTSGAYITTKVRQASGHASFAVSERTLYIYEDSDEYSFETRIYLEDGILYEAFGLKGQPALAETTPIAQAKEFDITFISADLLKISLVDLYGIESTTIVHVQPTQEGVQ